MTAKIIMLSGTKGVGKSEFAKQLAGTIADSGKVCNVVAFADKLKEVAYRTLMAMGFTEQDVAAMLFTEMKEETNIFLEDLTPRDFICTLSEDLIKPFFGYDVWINEVASFIRESEADYIIIEDMRTDDEYTDISMFFDVTTIYIHGETVYECKNDYEPEEVVYDMDIHSTGKTFVWEYDRDSNVFNTILEEIDATE